MCAPTAYRVHGRGHGAALRLGDVHLLRHHHGMAWQQLLRCCLTPQTILAGLTCSQSPHPLPPAPLSPPASSRPATQHATPLAEQPKGKTRQALKAGYHGWHCFASRGGQRRLRARGHSHPTPPHASYCGALEPAVLTKSSPPPMMDQAGHACGVRV